MTIEPFVVKLLLSILIIVVIVKLISYLDPKQFLLSWDKKIFVILLIILSGTALFYLCPNFNDFLNHHLHNLKVVIPSLIILTFFFHWVKNYVEK